MIKIGDQVTLKEEFLTKENWFWEKECVLVAIDCPNESFDQATAWVSVKSGTHYASVFLSELELAVQ